MAFPPNFLDEVRGRLPLDRLVGRKVRLTKAGRDWKGLCPFHNEKTPSFHVFADHYHCYGCGAHGDQFRWVMETEKASFPEAVERLAAEAGMEVPRASPQAEEAARRIKGLHDVAEAVAGEYERRLWLPEGAPALAYLRRRGLADETIRKFRLGWSGEGRGALAGALARQEITTEQLVAAGAMKQDEGRAPVDLFFGRVMFPIQDARGRVIAFGGRVLDDGPADRKGPKYVNSPETALFKKSRTLYGAHLVRDALRAGAKLAVVEGYMDVIALAQAGHGAAVAPLGTALTEQHLEALWRIDPCPVLCFDGDAAGARAAERAMSIALPALASGQSLAFVRLPQGEDPDTLVQRSGGAVFQAHLAKAEPLATALYLAVAGQPAATPEARAAQKQRLDELSGQIADPTLRAEYRRHFNDAWYAARRTAPPQQRNGQNGRRAGPPPRPAARPTLEPAAARAKRERDLLLLVLDHPSLLAIESERLGCCAFSHSATESLRAALCEHAESLFQLDSPALVNHVRVLGFGAELDTVLGPAISTLRPRHAADTPHGPRWLFDNAYRVFEIEALASDVAAAEASFRSSPTPESERRLRSLAEARNAAIAALTADPPDAD